MVLGALQNENSPILFGIVLAGFLLISSLHLLAAFRERSIDQPLDEATAEWVKACLVNDIKNDRAKIVTVSGERVAIFKYNGKLSAVNNFCRHQGGPLGEGKVVDGCITCPWHGWQYDVTTGQHCLTPSICQTQYETKVEEGEIFVAVE